MKTKIRINGIKKLLVIITIVCFNQLNAQVCFSSATNYTSTTTPHSVISVDFNNDTKLDLAVANYGSNNISILLGTGFGTFGTTTNFTVGTQPISITSSDFNSDGKADLAVANWGSNNVSILLGNGTGTFGTLNCTELSLKVVRCHCKSGLCLFL